MEENPPNHWPTPLEAANRILDILCFWTGGMASRLDHQFFNWLQEVINYMQQQLDEGRQLLQQDDEEQD
jgi:NADH:ubiquinone oxidoreductase subunit D